MIVFVILAVAAVGVIGFVLARPLLVSGLSPATGSRGRDINLAILREEHALLEREREAGKLDDAAYRTTLEELERRTLEDVSPAEAAVSVTPRRPRLALALGLTLPAAVAGLYLLLGSPEAFHGAAGKPGTGEGGHALGPEQIIAMVERLSEKLQANPNDGEGWLMLARSYSVLGRFPESAAAYGRAVNLLPPNAQTLADFADTVAMAQGRRLQGEPERIVRRALEVDGRNLKALALAGTILFEKGDYRGAIGEWQKVRALVPDDSNVARGMENSIRDAENRLAAGGGAPRTVAAAQGSGVAVKGRVSLDPALKTKVSPQDTVFIFARAEQGPKMPVAMIKRTVADLPLDFTLDDSQAMSPNLRLSQQTRVVVGARVSRSGDALPRPGDWQAFSGAIAPGTGDVKLVIDMPVQ